LTLWPRGNPRCEPAQPAPAEHRRGSMDALKLLKQDHDEVKTMLSDLEDTTERAEKTRTEGLATLKAELEVHELIEEEIFYPALKEHPKTKDLALEGYEEHHVVDMVMGEIEGIAPNDETWMAKFTVMKENLEHHIEEEEGEMFEQARKVFDDDELGKLGDRMQARKEELKTQA
ncbi:MAG: hemerythrin domain-containing protein, partial [Actinomycetota bacterium]|nr:hemerythrin domain-containing protein [Actinomycetota bacterium]